MLASRLSTNADTDETSILVVVPAWNEERSIAEVLECLRACADPLAGQGVRLSICVVDDGSIDCTPEVAHRAGADHVLSHGSNRGLAVPYPVAAALAILTTNLAKFLVYRGLVFKRVQVDGAL